MEPSHTSESRVMVAMSDAHLSWKNPDLHQSNQSQFPKWSYAQPSWQQDLRKYLEGAKSTDR